MPRLPSKRSAPERVLAIFPHRRVSGRVVLSRGRVVRGSVAAIEMRSGPRDRLSFLEEKLVQAIERYAPSVVAVAIDERRPCSWTERVVEICRRHAVATVVVCTQALIQRLFHRSVPRGYDKVAQIVASHLPELRARVRTTAGSAAAASRRRSAATWRACLAALDVAGAFTSARPLHETV